MISEGRKDFNKNDSNPNHSIEIGGGIGTKLDKRVFVHEDLTESRSKDKKPRVDNVDLEGIKDYVQKIKRIVIPLVNLWIY